MNKPTIKFTKFKPNAIIPTKEYHNAGYDIYPCFEKDFIIIKSHETVLIPTGIGSVLPTEYYFQIQERGSTGSKGIKYSAGVIDSSYRGEWFLAVTNTNAKPVVIAKPDVIEDLDSLLLPTFESDYILYPYDKALFQAILHKVEDVNVEEIDLEEFITYTTERGDGCLGSSNK